jgi:uncharacterized protein (TIGR03437 family)
MSKLFSRNTLAVLVFAFPIAALADTTGTPNLSAGSTLNLDTGATGTSGGDVLWDGTNLTPQGSATAIDVTTIAGPLTPSYSSVTSSLINTLAATYSDLLSPKPITPKSNDLLIVKTNGGNFAKVLVSSITGTSVALKFDTFGSSTPSGPNITGLTNNYSGIAQGLPNYGIAPGSLFVIYGTNLASTTNTKEAFPLVNNLSGTSVSVSVGGTTVQPGLYYVTAGQIAGVLPSSTPTGQATITVTNGSTTSNAFTFQVVQSAFGIDTVYQTGSGQGVVTDANYKLITFNYSASPGQAVIIWGSGVGADTKNDDISYPLPHQDNLTNIPMQAYVGGVSASILYRGRSQFPGVDQVVITIPQNAPTGCNVSIVLVSGTSSTASNFITTAVNPNGGTCSDPNSPYSVTSLTGDSTVSFGFVDITQDVSNSALTGLAQTSTHIRTARPFTARGPRAAAVTTNNDAGGIFESIQGVQLGNYASYHTASVGSCVVYQESLSSITLPPFTETGLDAGNITVTGPSGTVTLTPEAEIAGFYGASLSDSFITPQGGSFTFNGSGGKNVGSFSTTVTLGSPLFSWTNMSTTTSVTRSKGVTVTWRGGESGTYVEISGYSAGNSAAAGFYCLAKQEDLQFAVPSWVTSSLPEGSGTLDVSNASNPVKFTATGLNVGFADANVDDSTQIPYN